MRAAARLEVQHRDGRDVLVDARSEAPLAIRQTPDRILFVGSAASPVGGDEIVIEVVVGAGATASIGTVAATSIWPGPSGERSHTHTTIDVGDGGHLDWWPEPLVSIVESDHRSVTRLALGQGAHCTLIEELSLGRSGQASGTLELDLRVERHSSPIVHHVERFGPTEPGAGSVVGVGAAHHVISGVVVGPEPGEAVTLLEDDGQAAWLPVAVDAAMILVVAADRPAALRLLGGLYPFDARRVAGSQSATVGA